MNTSQFPEWTINHYTERLAEATTIKEKLYLRKTLDEIKTTQYASHTHHFINPGWFIRIIQPCQIKTEDQNYNII